MSSIFSVPPRERAYKPANNRLRIDQQCLDWPRILSMHRNGRTNAEIAYAAGTSEGSIRKLLWDRGLKGNKEASA